MSNNSIIIKFSVIEKLAYIYFTLPILVFLLGWTNFYIGVPVTLLVVYAAFKSLSLNNKDERIISFSYSHFPLILILFAIWCYISGPYFYQTWDFHGRNPIFRDLINFTWPVIYPETGNGLVYYFFQWLVPALFGKIFGWEVANFTLVVWNFIGVFIVYSLVSFYCRPKQNQMLFLAFLMIIWGGVSEIGLNVMYTYNKIGFLPGAAFGWSDPYQFTPNFGLLEWVFNQTIVTWIITMLFLIQRNIKTVVFLGIGMMPFAPLPFLGFVMVVTGYYFYLLISEKNKLNLIKDAISIPNVISTLTLLPIVYLFFSLNNSGGHIGFFTTWESLKLHWLFFVFFYIIQFGIYVFVIYPRYKKNIMLWIVFLVLLIVPHIQIGFGRDFGMRASIPGLFILMVFTYKFLLEKISANNTYNIRAILLVFCLSMNTLSFLKDISIHVNEMIATKTFPIVSDDVKTFSNLKIGQKVTGQKLGKDQDFWGNFMTDDEKDKLFYKYISR